MFCYIYIIETSYVFSDNNQADVIEAFKFIITQGDSNSEDIAIFGTQFKASVDLIQILKVITVWGVT